MTTTLSASDSSRCVLRMADTCLILGHRMSELMGHAPILEEDLSIANIALELVDQSREWLTLAGTLEARGRDEDALAYTRAEHEFLSVTLVEQKNGHFGDTVMRQLLLSCWQRAWYQAAQRSANQHVKELATRFLPQAEFHYRWAADWTVRLGDGTPLSHNRIQQSANALWKFTGELFESDELDRVSTNAGWTPAPESLRTPWQSAIEETFAIATLQIPNCDTLRWHGKRGEHGEELGLLLAEMQSLARAHPGAEW